MIFGQLAPLVLFVRIAAALGGAIVGYFLSGPVLRLLYRLAFQRSVPGWLMPVGRLGGAVLVGLVFFFIVAIGGSGFGLGPGLGGGPGTGPGKSSGDKRPVANGKQMGPARAKLEIELLGGRRYKGADRYYLVQGDPAAKTLPEVEALIKEKADKLEVHLVLTDDSVLEVHSAAVGLHKLLRDYQIPTVAASEKQ